MIYALYELSKTVVCLNYNYNTLKYNQVHYRHYSKKTFTNNTLTDLIN